MYYQKFFFNKSEPEMVIKVSTPEAFLIESFDLSDWKRCSQH